MQTVAYFPYYKWLSIFTHNRTIFRNEMRWIQLFNIQLIVVSNILFWTTTNLVVWEWNILMENSKLSREWTIEIMFKNSENDEESVSAFILIAN